jgi:hypothetical protein
VHQRTGLSLATLDTQKEAIDCADALSGFGINWKSEPERIYARAVKFSDEEAARFQSVRKGFGDIREVCAKYTKRGEWRRKCLQERKATANLML